MKMRMGFVSNSSSSSFIVCGFSFDDMEEVVDAVRKIAGDDFEKIEAEVAKYLANDDYWEIPYALSTVLPDGIELQSVTEDMDDFYLGQWRNPETLRLDEVRKGFISDEAYAKLEKIGEVIGKEICVDGGEMYN